MSFSQKVACFFGDCPPPPPPPYEETNWVDGGRDPEFLNTCTRGTDSSDDAYLWRVANGDANAVDNHIPEDQVRKGCPDSGDNRWGLCPVDGDGNPIDTEDDTIFHASKVNWHHGVNILPPTSPVCSK